MNVQPHTELSETIQPGANFGGDPGGPERPDRLTRVPWFAVAVFVAISFTLAWAIAMPAWFISQDRPGYQALFTALASAMMFTPAIATLVVVFVCKVPGRGSRARYLLSLIHI